VKKCVQSLREQGWGTAGRIMGRSQQKRPGNEEELPGQAGMVECGVLDVKTTVQQVEGAVHLMLQ
jgi:hypothetical protein